MPEPIDPADVRIHWRLGRARAALDRSLDALKTVMRRIDRNRARIGRLEAVLAIPAEERRARAARALATRRERRIPVHRRRGIRVDEEGQ